MYEDFVFCLQVQEKMFRKVDVLDKTGRMPDFLVALRPHTVWEKTPVKLFCTVQGNPRPIVKWSEPSRLFGLLWENKQRVKSFHR